LSFQLLVLPVLLLPSATEKPSAQSGTSHAADCAAGKHRTLIAFNNGLCKW